MKKALVVDDTKNIRTLLTTCLEIEGFNVQTANDGKNAIDILLKEAFDLVFLDIKMPEMSGTEVLKRIREQGIDTPVVIITAFATVRNAIECTKLGAVAYLQKPFTSDKVRSVLADFHKFEPNKSTDENSIITEISSLIDSNSYEDALVCLKKAFSIDPNNAELYFLFGKVYEGMGEKELANKFYRTFDIFKEG